MNSSLSKIARIFSWGKVSDGILPPHSVGQSVWQGAKRIKCGLFHNGLLDSEGSLFTWGRGSAGRLGLGVGTETNAQRDWEIVEPQRINLESKVSEFSFGGLHSLALDEQGQAFAFGACGWGQLGLDKYESEVLSPERVECFEQPVQSIAAGGAHSLFLLSDGTVHACGRTEHGRLGVRNALASSIAKPKQVTMLSHAVSISAGGFHSAAIRDDGSVWTWGGGQNGELGRGKLSNATTPDTVINLPSNIVEISLGGFHSLALTDDGKVFGWGYNGHMQLSNLANASRQPEPFHMDLFEKKIVRIVAGGSYSLFLDEEGCVWSLGANGDGQCGTGGRMAKAMPVQVPLPGPAIDVSGGGLHAAALVAESEAST